MPPTVGHQATLTSWSGSPFLVTNAACYSMAISEASDDFLATVFGGTSDAYAIGLPAATASMSFRWPAAGPLVGSGAIVKVPSESFYEDSNDQIIGVVGYTLNIETPPIETTSHSDASLGKTYVAGIPTWSGTITLRLDDTKALENAQRAGASTLTAEFYLDSTRYFTGEMWVGGVTHDGAIGVANGQTFNFRGTGALTAVGSGNIYAAAAIAVPSSASLVATYVTGRTVTGSAFPTSVSISASRDQLIDIAVQAQYTGLLTKA